MAATVTNFPQQFPLSTVPLVSASVGRVFVRTAGSDEDFVHFGQCVCVVHPRLLLTSAHAMRLSDGTALEMRVGFKGAARDFPLQLFVVTPLRCIGGEKGVALLRVDSEVGSCGEILSHSTPSSPFTPLAVGGPECIAENDGGRMCALVYYDLCLDASVLRYNVGGGRKHLQDGLRLNLAQLSHLPHHPSFFPKSVAAVDMRLMRGPDVDLQESSGGGDTAPSVSRGEWLIALCPKSSDSGAAGAAVIGLSPYGSAHDGQPVLLGVHLGDDSFAVTHSFLIGAWGQEALLQQLQQAEAATPRPVASTVETEVSQSSPPTADAAAEGVQAGACTVAPPPPLRFRVWSVIDSRDEGRHARTKPVSAAAPAASLPSAPSVDSHAHLYGDGVQCDD